MQSKFQIYFGDTLVSRVMSPERNAHFKRFELTPDEHLTLAERVRAAGCAYVASVWDLPAFEWIDPAVTAYKIGSGDLTATPFLRAAAATGRPIILSTGLANINEVAWSVEFLRSAAPRYRQRDALAVLQCTSMYPIASPDAHLGVLEAFTGLGVAIGYSDHTVGLRALEVAAAMGAEVLEFHFTDQKDSDSFRDHQLSLDIGDVKELIGSLDEIRALKGTSVKIPIPIETDNDHVRSFRRGVYALRAIATGEVLDHSNLCVLRPNHGIDARDYESVIGRRARRELRMHDPLDWSDIE